ncbi:MAG: PEP-CTERM sorting domain-containing protein [Planctomycetota bacterium]
MMKKLLVLMMILGLASSANAIVLEISFQGQTDLADSDIYVDPSVEYELDIYGHGMMPTGDDVYWALVVDTTTATISGGTVLVPPAGSLSSWFGNNAASAGIPGLMANEDGPWGSFAVAPAETAGPGIYANGFIFHCEAPDIDAVVRLITTPDFANYIVQDTMTIHQIPEPMTVALLGMGGLFLLRRRR